MRRYIERLGTRLLQRNSRSVAVTEAGERLLQRLGPALDEIGEALDHLGRARTSVTGSVRITATRQAYEAVIRPVLPGFNARHPDAVVEVMIEYELRDIIADRMDAGIRIGEKLEQDMVALSVSPELRMAVVGSPDYLADRPAPERPEDLRAHRCINYRMRVDGALMPWWFARDGRDMEVRTAGPLVVNEPELALDAALDGVGLAYVLEERAAPFVASGRLVRLMENWTPRFPGFFLYYPSRRQMPPALEAFVAALRRRRRAMPDPVS